MKRTKNTWDGTKAKCRPKESDINSSSGKQHSDYRRGKRDAERKVKGGRAEGCGVERVEGKGSWFLIHDTLSCLCSIIIARARSK